MTSFLPESGCGPPGQQPTAPAERPRGSPLTDGIAPWELPGTERTLARRFEWWADATPEALAVKHGDEACSYFELDRRANAIAQAILASSATPAGPVAILLETGITVIATMLGVWKAGRFYVVLDPGHPAARNQHIAAHAQPSMFVTDARSEPVVRALAGEAAVIVIDALDARAAQRPERAIEPDDFAWLIYTSGSTGTPKGVVQSHRNALHNAERQQVLARWGPGDRMTWLYSPGVMGATRGLTAALLHGAALFPRDPRQDSPVLFARWLEDEHITVYHSVASLFRTVFGQLEATVVLPSTRLVMFGGERVGTAEVELVRRHLPAARIYTGLGTTETGTVSHLLVDPHAPPAGDALPLGSAVDGVRVELRDDANENVGRGEVGEIVVVSRHLALGYWRDSSMTEATFRVGADAAAGREYHSGDLGRFDAQQQLRHVGRKDFQVKIRGFRVEVAEIEFVLQQHPAVHEAVVMGQSNERGEQWLAAYCVAAAGGPPPATELRCYLRERLPRHMTPAAITFLPALPRTPNGKIDRRMLPHLAPGSLTEGDFVPPQAGAEEQLAEIWSEVLDHRPISRHDNYFELGGNSLSAMQVSSRIRRAFSVELPPRALLLHPTLAELAVEVARLRHEERPLDSAPLIAVAREPLLPLSYAQERLWFLDQLEPGSAAYHITRTFRIRGELDVEALGGALDDIVRRHEVLRTVYTVVDGAPKSQVLEHPRVSVTVRDLMPVAAPTDEMAVQRFVESEADRPFNLRRDVLVRASVARATIDESWLVLTMHHIASDGWSVALLLRELTELYAARRDGRTPQLVPLPIQYADFAVWQRQTLCGPERQRQLAFWRETLAGAPPVLELPCDFPRPAAPTGRGAAQAVSFPSAVVEKMNDLSRRAGATPFVTWFAAFQVLLSRCSGQNDLLVATPVAGRSRVELEPLIGFFVNTLVFRANLAGDPTFADFLSRFRRHALDVFAHDELPFEQLVQELQPERRGSHPPLVQVMFAWQNTPRTALALANADVRPVPAGPRWAKFDLTLSLEESPGGVSGVFEFNTDLFRPDTIARLAERFVTLVVGIVERPELRLSELPVLPAAERALLDAWSGRHFHAAPQATVLDKFEAQVTRTPAIPAIRAAGQELTYQALDDAACRIAGQLTKRGVGPADIVGVCLGRRTELGAALLGVWKVGAAFLPLDPAYPSKRLEFMLRDSGAKAVVVGRQTREWFIEAGLPTVDVDAERGDAADELGGQMAAAPPAPNDLAYLIYTSGSTGTPKGVAVPHCALSRHNAAIVELFALTAADRVLQFGALGFDASLEEIFPTWLSGGVVVLRTEACALSVSEFLSFVEHERITVLNLPTAFWHELVHGLAGQGLPPRVRLVAIGGEKATADDLWRWQDLVSPDVRLLNAYGPTETTITATWFDATRFREPTVTGTIPIGRPIAGTQAYVVDPAGRLAPIGTWGELQLGGECLARGYHERPALTAEKFRPDPFSERDGARVFRTGDVVRWLADGQLEFRERVDEQVKWRGFRIELGEIESALRQLPGVGAAVVMLRASNDGAPRLVGYMAPAGTAPNPASALAALRDLLPDFMVPTDLVAIDALPTTPSGKIDRAALPAPVVVDGPGLEPAFTPTEERLRDIWQDVLGVPVTTASASFFALGGHSLLAVRLYSRIETAFGVTPPLAALFTSPTLRQLATLLEREQARSDAGKIVTLKCGAGPPLFFVPGAGAGMLWGYANLARHYAGQRPICALPVESAMDAAASGGLEQMAARQVTRLRAMQPNGPYHLAGYCFGGNVAYEIARQLVAGGESVGLLAVFDTAPSNSAYYRVRLNRQFVAGFARNLWLTFDEVVRLPAAERRERLRPLWTRMRRRLAWLVGKPPARLTDTDLMDAEIEAILPDFAQYPEHELKLWHAHLRMMAEYHPQPADLSVVLFRTKRRPLWRSHEPTLGWAALARSGVEIELVSGTHATLMREPHVGALAAQLAARLEPATAAAQNSKPATLRVSGF